MKNNQSEFGKGLVVNLVKFYEHFSNDQFTRIKHTLFYLSKTDKEKELMLSDNPPSNLKYGKSLIDNIKYFRDVDLKIYQDETSAISHMITLWANGATDHLFEIETPKGKEWNDIRELVIELQNKGLDMGHGFKDNIYEYKDVIELYDLVKKISILIDKKLGLNPDWGEF